MATATFGATSRADVDDRRSPEDEDHAVGPHDRTRRVALLVPAALMLGLGLLGLDRHSVWRDEAASLVAARRSLPELETLLGRLETVHALYYTLLHGWLQLGGGEAWARVPSVLAMTLAAWLVGVVGARVASVPVGVVAGLLFVANPSVSYYAQEARSTALVVALALLSTWLLLQAVERRPRWWVGYAAAGAVLVALNLLAVLVLVSLGVTMLWWRSPRRVLLRWALATAPALLVCLTLVAVTSRQPFQISWIPRPGPSSVRDLAHLALGPTLPVVVLVALLVLVGVLPSRSDRDRRLRALALPLLALPSGGLLAVSFLQPIFVPRYVFPSVAAATLLAALGLVRLGRAAARRTRPSALPLVAAAAVLVVGLGGVGAQRLERTPASRPDDLAGAAAVVAAGARPGDVVLFLPDNRRLVELAYPGSFTGVRDIALAEGPDTAGNLTGRPLPLPETLRQLADSPRVWAIGRPGLSLLPSETDARTELALLDRTFVPTEHTGSHGVGITLYVRRSPTS